MEYFIILVIAIIGITLINFSKEKEIMRVEWDKVAQFIGFMALVTFARIAAYYFMLQTGIIKQLPVMYPEVMESRWTLMLVFWEDFFFGVPLYFIHKYMNEGWKRHLKLPLTVMISLLFGLGHTYQGWEGVAITSIVPYFVCLKYGRLYGFGTTMVCHILYDNITVYSIVMLPYLLGMY